MNHQAEVRLAAGAECGELDRQVIALPLQDEILRYLQAAPEHFRTAAVRVVFHRLRVYNDGERVYCQVAAQVFGILNGAKFSCLIERDLTEQLGASQEATEAGIAAGNGLLGLLLYKSAKAIGGALSGEAGKRRVQEKTLAKTVGRARKLKEDLLLQIAQWLDASIKRPASVRAGRWITILVASAAAFFVSTIISSLVMASYSYEGLSSERFLERMRIGALFSIPVFFSAMAWGLVSLPLSFFQHEAAGRELTVVIGAGSPQSVKPLCIVVGVLGVLFTVGMVWMSAGAARY